MDHSEPALALFGSDGPDLGGTGMTDTTVPAIDELSRPLADRLRPRTLGQVVGQEHLLADEAPIGRMVQRRHLVSVILWGPPGCGKTTIALLLADAAGLVFAPLSATFSGVADLRRVFRDAEQRRAGARGRCCSWTRSIASTAPSRTASCRTWRTARSSWSARPPRTRASN
ncbi:AAA family ATPase [Streptomyces sp. NPDC097617]|uniref:AAA family ATPase n=1 Tax=Streptomyces sp. NPDC097617 TaxID=3366091 RepID=UPI003808C744